MDFDEFCEVYKLNSETKEKLQTEGLTDLDNILELTTRDMDHLDIKPLGQRKALTRGIQAQRKDTLKCLHEKISNLKKPDKKPGEAKDSGPSKIVSIGTKLAEAVKQHHDEKRASEELKQNTQCKAIYAYTAQRPDELSVKEGEILTVNLMNEVEGYVQATNRDGKSGLVPRNYIQPVKIEKPVGRVRPNVCTESEESEATGGSDGSFDDEVEEEHNELQAAEPVIVYQQEASEINQVNENRDVKLLLVGITGSGKSSSGNTILSTHDANIEGKLIEFFRTAVNSGPQTKDNEFYTKPIDGRKVTVVDTPGSRNRRDNAKSICAEILNAIRLAKQEKEGYSAIVCVNNIFERDVKMNDETINTLNLLKEMMGPDFYKYAIFLFTYGSSFESKIQMEHNYYGKNIPELTFEEFIMKDALATDKFAIGPFITEANGRAVLFENSPRIDPQLRKMMVSNLLKKVDEIHVSQGGKKFWRGNLPVKKGGISCLTVISVVVVIIAILVVFLFSMFHRDLSVGKNSKVTV